MKKQKPLFRVKKKAERERERVGLWERTEESVKCVEDYENWKGLSAKFIKTKEGVFAILCSLYVGEKGHRGHGVFFTSLINEKKKSNLLVEKKIDPK